MPTKASGQMAAVVMRIPLGMPLALCPSTSELLVPIGCSVQSRAPSFIASPCSFWTPKLSRGICTPAAISTVGTAFGQPAARGTYWGWMFLTYTLHKS